MFPLPPLQAFVAKCCKHAVTVCLFGSFSSSILNFVEYSFTLTRLIECYKGKSNFMNIKYTWFMASLSLPLICLDSKN